MLVHSTKCLNFLKNYVFPKCTQSGTLDICLIDHCDSVPTSHSIGPSTNRMLLVVHTNKDAHTNTRYHLKIVNYGMFVTNKLFHLSCLH